MDTEWSRSQAQGGLRLVIQLSFFEKKIIYFWLSWAFVAVHRLSLVAASGGHSAVVHRLLTVASLVAEHGL